MTNFPRCELHLSLDQHGTRLTVDGEDLQTKLPIVRISIDVTADRNRKPVMIIECLTANESVRIHPKTVIAALRAEAERIETLMREAAKAPLNSVTVG